MNNVASAAQGQNPLDALAPNILPAPIGTWPPAIGWWILLALALAALIAAVLLILRWYRRSVYRRSGCRQLKVIREQFQQHNDRQRYLRECNYLLKSVALQAYPRKDVASLSGQEWQVFLDKSLDKTRDKAGLSKIFTKGPGRAVGTTSYEKGTGVDPEPLYRTVDVWIRKHHV
ncbi:DUF4381 domain-containing protein [Sansalvadorimonas sp. 2012CJ34-2]|uniref:DUF4381 domain-containing protein n=1 Tax=Parendozoicomonas callyspongiae TaxID=2942213 RepID=A0ABT0PEH0_9GAMM|nr:DUF4381 domain-containing protein [Sansalvadorimonas sp. 2012CJ34-2]MCL6269778.1 DUF4381 domain-containing protein [Sansalvadorimonas sp. 2012CJ34-2]